MKVWRHSSFDAVLLTLSVFQLVSMVALSASWGDASILARIRGFGLLVVMISYNVIVVSHLFTHNHWFSDHRLNALASALNSINIGQSVRTYQLNHVRNHHVFNNDRKGLDGGTKDTSSTYRDGVGDEHASLFRYAFVGAAATLLGIGRGQLSIVRLWRVGRTEIDLLRYLPASGDRRRRELHQIQMDRTAQFLSLAAFSLISWQWLVFCYVPALYVALALVNIQNFYEHYGAHPEIRTANAVSHYGRLYNRLTFNDGYHQEHHLNPAAHWTALPGVRDRHRERLAQTERVISPVPAIVGFLDRGRPLLHRTSARNSASEVGVGVLTPCAQPEEAQP